MQTHSSLPGFGSAAVPQESGELELRPAKLSDRFIAYLLDLFPFAAGCIGSLYVLVVTMRAAEPTTDFVYRLCAVWLALLILYQWAGNALGGTVGKRLMGLEVARLDGQPLGVVRSLLRALGYLFSTPLCNFGFIIALFHPESRALHDLFSGSIVIESRPKSAAETWVLFLGAVLALAALFGGNIFYHLDQPYPSDLLAIDKAREGLLVLAQCQETHRERAGRYTQSIGDLASASGDAAQFKAAMLAIFQPDLFRLEASLTGYRISGAAKDRKKTRVTIEGPVKQPAP